MPALVIAIVLGGLHVCLRVQPARERFPTAWRSAAAGSGVAYVMVYLLPAPALNHRGWGIPELGWLLALVGLLSFYGLEAMAGRHFGTYGNQKTEWDSGSRFGFENPEYR